MVRFFKSLYLSPRFFWALGTVVLLFLMAYFFTGLLFLCKLALFALAFLLLLDMLLLYRVKQGVFARRDTPEKLSNGDGNPLFITIENRHSFGIHLTVIDELPFQFQLRNVNFERRAAAGQTVGISYKLRPTERGEYSFGALNVYVSSPLGLARRRYRFGENTNVAVYPSFMQMRKYELLAISNRLHEFGLKKIRRIGHSMEFEQIKEYVPGDDYRTVNWKATARQGQLMVNQYQDERSQQVYSIIDKGRVMKMPFAGLSLLDYAINAALVISNIAIKKGDKAGLVSFAEQTGTLLAANKRNSQMRSIQELLYKESTGFLESDYEKLYATLRRKVTQRSLLLLFTNFESLGALERQLPYLQRMAKRHLLVVIFFENTELNSLLHAKAGNIEQVYQKTVAEKFAFEKKLIKRELQQHGIQCILTAPENLTVNTINKYLELKARGLV